MAGTEILQFCLRPGYPQAEGRSAALEAAQARNGIRCSVGEEGRVVSSIGDTDNICDTGILSLCF